MFEQNSFGKSEDLACSLDVVFELHALPLKQIFFRKVKALSGAGQAAGGLDFFGGFFVRDILGCLDLPKASRP